MRYALTVASATAGLLAIGLALGLKNCDFVTTPYTFGASLAPWLVLSNRPVFADIDPQTLGLDPTRVPGLMSRRTRALLAVDVYGIPSDSVGLRRVADAHGLWYIADAAQSFGATRGGEAVSKNAHALLVSFTAGKALFAGEGGAILTNNQDIYQRLLWHCQHPQRQRRELGLGVWNEFGLNARIHPLAAIWANAVFEKSLSHLRNHQMQCLRLIDALNDIGLTEEILFREQGIQPAFFRVSAAWRKRRSEPLLCKELARRGFPIETEASPVSVLYQQPAFLAQYGSSLAVPPVCPNAEKSARHRFCMRPQLSSTCPNIHV